MNTPRNHTSHSFGRAVRATLGWVLCCGAWLPGARAETNYAPYQVMALAGRVGVAGSADGTGNFATFNNPGGIAVDPAGAVYVADTYNSTIRKITAAGVVTTIAGAPGLPGSTDGNRGSARFDLPWAITSDPAGNLYVVDYVGTSIRKITPAGVVSTLVPSLSLPGGAFQQAQGVAADAAGNVYVLDANNTVRKVTPAGAISTLAGRAGQAGYVDGPGDIARFSLPTGIAADAAGNLYVADYSNQVIRKISPAGNVTTLAGIAGRTGADDGPASTATFNYPYGVATDGLGYVYVFELFNLTVRRISPNGQVETLAGSPRFSDVRDGIGGTATFRSPRAIAVDAQSNIFVLEDRDAIVRKGVPLPSRFGALSVRSNAGRDSSTLIAGFIINGNGFKPMVLRGVGPALAPMGVANALADPKLRLFNSTGAQIDSNDDWGGSEFLRISFGAVGLSALPADSKDAAMVAQLQPGSYTAHVTATTETGIALMEIYDAGIVVDPSRLTALSVRGGVGTGDQVLIVGIVIKGAAPKTVLVRGLGPALTAQGISGVLADPQLEIHAESALIAANDDWGGSATLATAFAGAGLGVLPAGSKDAALLVTLLPGIYTVQLSGVNNSTGIGLIEIYDTP